jgi:putative phosphoesterase
MKLLITSDVHQNLEALIDVIKRHKDIDLHINAGDMCLPIKSFEQYHIITVKGNNDFGTDLPYIREIEFDNKKIILTHGHLEHVKFGLEKLKLKAKLSKADIVIFGHTHERYLSSEEQILFINPGALGDYHRSYAIYENGQVTFHQR